MGSEKADRLIQLKRNGRWGTCAGCPRRDGKVWPEECQFAERYDHHLTAANLVEQKDYEIERLKEEQKEAQAPLAQTRAYILRRDLSRESIVRGLFEGMDVAIVKALIRKTIELYPCVAPDRECCLTRIGYDPCVYCDED